jgi:hypothetical protein
MPAKLRSGSATMSPADMRGSSDAYGSWKTICRSLRRWRMRSAESVVSSSPSSFTEPEVGSTRRTTDFARRRLAAARFADERERLAALDREGDVVHRLDRRPALADPRLGREVVLAQLLDRQEGRGLAHGATASAVTSGRGQAPLFGDESMRPRALPHRP